jgi:hypothetical protein
MAEEVNQVEENAQEALQQQIETANEENVAAESQQEKATSNVTVDEDGTIKLDLRQQSQTQEEDAVQEQETASMDVEVPTADSEKVDGKVRADNDESPVLELVQDEEVENTKEKSLSDKIKDIPNKLKEESESVNNNQETNELPENINKLVDFMRETGGTLEDYIKLNKDYDGMADMDLLREHYRQTKPHLDEDEISFLIEDSFSYDEEIDEERDIRRKKLALKESIAEAKSNLTNLKGKYYDELKLSSKLTPEQREAVQFYNDYKQEQDSTQKLAQQQRSIFEEKTNKLFTEDFKGFDYKVGDKKYRFNVKDVNSVKETQADINSLVSKFVNENNEMSDAAGYHKALFTAMNSDSIANHFYEQGKADAIKNQMAQSKNVDMNPRGTHEAVTTSSGLKIRAVSGDDSSKLRVKIRQ